jgi:hypothetical protein
MTRSAAERPSSVGAAEAWLREEGFEMRRISVALLPVLIAALCGFTSDAGDLAPGPRVLRIVSAVSSGEVEFEGTVASVQSAGKVVVLGGKTPFEVELPPSLIVATVRAKSEGDKIYIELVEQRSEGELKLTGGQGPNVVLVEGLEPGVRMFTRTFASPTDE